MDYKLINKIIDDVYGEFGNNYENALRELFYEYDKQKEIIDKIKEYCIKEKVLPLGEQVDYILELLEEIE